MSDAGDASASPPSAQINPPLVSGRHSRELASVERSDQIAGPILKMVAQFEPEVFAPIGVSDTARRIARLPPDWPGEKLDAYQEALGQLAELRDGEQDAELRLDWESMTTFLSRELDVVGIESALMLPCPDLAQTIVLGTLNLLTSLPPGSPRAPVVTRLRRYAGLEGGIPPLTRQAETLIRSHLRRDDLLGPWREALLRHLQNGDKLIVEFPRILEQHGVTGHENALGNLQQQLADYHDFLRREVLPRCRPDFRLPPELYAARLKRHGVEMAIDELSHRAESAFGDLRRQLDDTARRLARRRGWQGASLQEVLERLTRERLDNGELLDHYARRHRQLDDLIVKTRFATLPRDRHFTLRLAGEAESAVVPFPYIRWPREFGGCGNAGEINLPQAFPGNIPGHSYASPAASWVIAAHEGFPGHALQLARLLEPDVSLARGLLAFNDAALEGWAVYAQSEIFPDLPLEARFLTLHAQLRRAAGSFLDPGLQQGRFTRQQANRLLRERVGIPAEEADQLLWRYTGWAPGQATTYFYGHIQLAALRTAVECRLGAAFDRCAYHDALLAQGLLPLSLLRRCVLEQFGVERWLAA